MHNFVELEVRMWYNTSLMSFEILGIWWFYYLQFP